MNADLILAQLLSVRATIEALIVEVEDSQRKVACCDNPKIVATDTYGGREVRCGNCGKDISAPSGPNNGG